MVRICSSHTLQSYLTLREKKQTNKKASEYPDVSEKSNIVSRFTAHVISSSRSFTTHFALPFQVSSFFKLSGLRAFSTSAIFPVWLSPKMGHHPKIQLLPQGCSPTLHFQPSFLILSQGRPSERKKKKSRFKLNIQKAFCGFFKV